MPGAAHGAGFADCFELLSDAKKSRNTKSVCMYLVVALWITLVFCNEVTMPIEGKMCVPTVYMGRKLCLVALDQQKKKNMS